MSVDPFTSRTNHYEAWFDKNDQLFAAEVEAVRQLLPPFGRAIEIGVGTGLFAHALGIQEGLDPSPAMLARARKRKIRCIRASAEAIPLPDRIYDLALMVTVDCFLQDLAVALGEIWRILKPAAYLVLAMLDKAAVPAAGFQAAKSGSPFYQAARLHSAAEMRVSLARAGFILGPCRQTVFNLINEVQPVRPGTGQGFFAVLQAKKEQGC